MLFEKIIQKYLDKIRRATIQKFLDSPGAARRFRFCSALVRLSRPALPPAVPAGYIPGQAGAGLPPKTFFKEKS